MNRLSTSVGSPGTYGNFFRKKLVGKLTGNDLDQVLPIEVKSVQHTSLKSAAMNWFEHTHPLFASNEWLENKYYYHSPEVAQKIFRRLSKLNKALIQRGFEIKHDESYAPTFTGYPYCIKFRTKLDFEKNGNFPAEKTPKSEWK